MILSGASIRARGIFSPFSERAKAHGMTYGLGPAGYDVRVEFDKSGNQVSAAVWPGMCLLASTMERIVMPEDLIGVVHDKSSWARQGLALQNTVIEPGWQGWLTLEISNHTSDPITILRGAPIAQILLHQLDSPAEGYQGKYQNQARGPQRVR